MCQHFDATFIEEALGFQTEITDQPQDLDPYAFDLIYSQHQMAAYLIPALLAGLCDHEYGPAIVHNHLSPFEPREAPGPYFERHLTDLVWANSPETKARLADLAPWLDVGVVPKPSAQYFCAVVQDRPAPKAA